MGEGGALFPHPRPQAWGMMPVALGSMPLVLHGSEGCLLEDLPK